MLKLLETLTIVFALVELSHTDSNGFPASTKGKAKLHSDGS